MENTRPKPFLLLILDGWGYCRSQKGNAIHFARKPTWDTIWTTYPHTTLACSGLEVGLPEGQIGNSEVGHLTLGSGRVVYQDLTRIHKAIEDKTFFQNSSLIQALDTAISQKKAIHVLGLLSDGGVHSHESHIHALIEFAAKRNISEIYLHVFCDGRDTLPKSASTSITSVENLFKKCGKGKIASIIGRYYAMDRDHRWDRTQAAYDLITKGMAPYKAASAIEGLEMAYARGETDEFIKPTVINAPGASPCTPHPGDTVLFMNFRADRARQLTQAFIDPNFQFFKRRSAYSNILFVTLTKYSKEWSIPCLFQPIPLKNILTDVFAKQHMKQLRLAETEKYAHVTFFFNGGKEEPVIGEDRMLIPSPKVSTYDQQPDMSAHEITKHCVHAIKNQTHDVIICNFANADMVGHTGNFSATVSAIETLDICLSKIIDSLLSVGGEAIITADHGNAEKMLEHNTNNIYTAHTLSLVPLIYVGKRSLHFRNNVTLSDVAPTILELLHIEKPIEMTGKSLIIHE